MFEKPPPSIFDLIKTFFLLGTVSFGSGMFALIHQRLVEQQRWITEKEFEEAVTFAELAPGPFTIHLVMYIGYHLHKMMGLVVATIFFCLPSLIIIFVIAMTYEDLLSGIPGLEYFMLGVWASIMASMISTIITVGKNTLVRPVLVTLTALSVLAIVFWRFNFIWLILISGIFYTLVSWVRNKVATKGAEEASS